MSLNNLHILDTVSGKWVPVSSVNPLPIGGAVGATAGDAAHMPGGGSGPSAYANNQAANLWVDLNGGLYVHERQLQSTGSNPDSVQIGDGTNILGTTSHPMQVQTNGATVASTVTLTRTANTTAYSANQVIGAATSGGNNYLTFTGCARASGGSGQIIGVNIFDEENNATPVQPILFLFSSAPTASTINDGAALAVNTADGLNLITAVPLVTSYLTNAGTGNAGSRYYTAQGLAIGFKAAATSLFGILIANAAYTPVSGEVFAIQLQILQD